VGVLDGTLVVGDAVGRFVVVGKEDTEGRSKGVGATVRAVGKELGNDIDGQGVG
jgi:hypothetical protein